MTVQTLLLPWLLRTLVLLPPTGAEFGAPFALDCMAPLRWRIEAVDPRFGLSELDAADAVRQAGIVWAEAVSAPLIFQESPEGVPIRFVFDERMELALERQRRVAEIDARAATIEEGRSALDASRLALDRQRAAHEFRALDFEGRQESYNRAVEYWNEVGGAPPAEFARLQAIEEEIAELRRVVNAEAAEINRMVEAVNREADRLNSEISELNEARLGLDSELPARIVESAEYRQSGGGFLSSVTREIDVFHFENRDHLLRVLAHVMGHALGLEHSEAPGSLMEATATADANAPRPRALEEDAAQLRALCPEL